MVINLFMGGHWCSELLVLLQMTKGKKIIIVILKQMVCCLFKTKNKNERQPATTNTCSWFETGTHRMWQGWICLQVLYPSLTLDSNVTTQHENILLKLIGKKSLIWLTQRAKTVSKNNKDTKYQSKGSPSYWN